MKKYENTIKHIVKYTGGFREENILKHDHTIEKGETWNNEHKVLNILSCETEADGHRNGFQVDIVTMLICG